VPAVFVTKRGLSECPANPYLATVVTGASATVMAAELAGSGVVADAEAGVPGRDW
jgi:hypothetical protein